jgi:ribonucleoside-diphosphate reductase alpha chain
MPRIKRPKVTTGSCTKIATGCGKTYVTCNIGDNGEPVEVFCSLGKPGECAKCWNEALARIISISLQWGVPVQEFIDQLKELRCPTPTNDDEFGAVQSCPDAVSKVMAKVWGKIE